MVDSLSEEVQNEGDNQTTYHIGIIAELNSLKINPVTPLWDESSAPVKNSDLKLPHFQCLTFCGEGTNTNDYFCDKSFSGKLCKV